MRGVSTGVWSEGPRKEESSRRVRLAIRSVRNLSHTRNAMASESAFAVTVMQP